MNDKKDMKPEAEELKPCPFCGGEIFYSKGPFGGYREFHCNGKCQSRFLVNADTQEDAYKIFNTRTKPEADIDAIMETISSSKKVHAQEEHPDFGAEEHWIKVDDIEGVLKGCFEQSKPEVLSELLLAEVFDEIENTPNLIINIDMEEWKVIFDIIRDKFKKHLKQSPKLSEGDIEKLARWIDGALRQNDKQTLSMRYSIIIRGILKSFSERE